jgi:hypothetical protein
MTNRQNFSSIQRRSAFAENANWLRDHKVDGIQLALAFDPLRRMGQVYYCENCLFCHTDKAYFDVDHLVADRSFRVWGKHPEGRAAVNMVVLCKSQVRGDLGCNQSKGAAGYVPRSRGLAFTRADLDMNCCPLSERPFQFSAAHGTAK